MSAPLLLEQVARLPAPDDNAAVAIRRIEPGTSVSLPSGVAACRHTVPEGHRLAVRPILPGEALLSWGTPFGVALRRIEPGEYLCNETILDTLVQRRIDFGLPNAPNFKDCFTLYQFDEASFRPGAQAAPSAHPQTFQGYFRSDRRGAGTRNCVVILGTSSRAASFVRVLARRLQPERARRPNIDAIAPVAHTEGGGPSEPNNAAWVLRTLAGFMVHPNVAAVLAVDMGGEPIDNRRLEKFLLERGYPLDETPHAFLSAGSDFERSLVRGEETVRGWLAEADAARRTTQPLARLKIALQCGGSDAFSGISGNPLAGWVAGETIRHGGSALLAETDELIGAERYILDNARDADTARAFLAQIARFQERVGWHGLSAESNPSGGNLFRGLYNIVIKSIGAARKKPPEIRLDHVVEYAEPMTAPGYYFMDSPGNDLESIAGQVACGCNLILFTTGNGSITNFPFAPTLKIVNSTGRYDLLRNEMDVNAGRFLDGEPLDRLGRETFDLAVAVASGQLTRGEHAGHSQAQIWRDWRQTDRARLEALDAAPLPTGVPSPIRSEHALGARLKPFLDGLAVRGFETSGGAATDRIGLIVPTSLCSGQVGLIAARHLESLGLSGDSKPYRRFLALPHTEGCGVSGEDGQRILQRTMMGHLVHPSVRRGLLLEHGCEKTHNDAMRRFLLDHGYAPDRYGFASVQMDGGVERVTRRIAEWFARQTHDGAPRARSIPFTRLRVGLAPVARVPASVAAAFGALAWAIVAGGGTVVVPVGARETLPQEFWGSVSGSPDRSPSLAYGQPHGRGGFHLMDAPTDHDVEILTGLGAAGVDVILSLTGEGLNQGHPMIPTIAVGWSAANAADKRGPDLVLDATEPPETLAKQSAERAVRVLNGERSTHSSEWENTDFQVTRGWLGVST